VRTEREAPDVAKGGAIMSQAAIRTEESMIVIKLALPSATLTT
jgi:hypothetical protein